MAIIASLQAVHDSMNHAMDSIAARTNNAALGATLPEVSAMTITCRTSASSVDLDALQHLLENQRVQDVLNQHADQYVFRVADRPMMASVTLKATSVGADAASGTRSITVFRNGILRICGSVDFAEASVIATITCNILEAALTLDDVMVADAGVGAINASFRLQDRSILLPAARLQLQALAVQRDDVTPSEQGPANAAVVKFAAGTGRYTCITLFASGKILVTGFTNGFDFDAAHAFITSFLTDNLGVVVV